MRSRDSLGGGLGRSPGDGASESALGTSSGVYGARNNGQPRQIEQFIQRHEQDVKGVCLGIQSDSNLAG